LELYTVDGQCAWSVCVYADIVTVLVCLFVYNHRPVTKETVVQYVPGWILKLKIRAEHMRTGVQIRIGASMRF